MATATTVPPLTYDDLDFLPKAREGDRQELFDGSLVATPSPIPDHQLVSGNTVRALDAVVRPNDLGRVYAAPIDVVFAPKVVAVPDVVFVSRGRLRIVGAKAIEGAPDLIVEILSPSTRRRDLGSKRALSARFGVPEYWTVDLARRAVAACLLDGDRYRCLDHAKGAVRSRVVPGLDVAVAALFAGL